MPGFHTWLVISYADCLPTIYLMSGKYIFFSIHLFSKMPIVLNFQDRKSRTWWKKAASSVIFRGVAYVSSTLISKIPAYYYLL